MKKKSLISVMFLLLFTQQIHANTPSEALQIAVDKIISVAKDQANDDSSKKKLLAQVLQQEVDFDAVSKRILAKHWKKASGLQRTQFKEEFLKIMTDTYFSLIKNYTDEKVILKKEQIKKNKYAIVDTQIATDRKIIPIRYRLIKKSENWKIYDFIPEGVSIVSTYKNNYASTLKKSGVQGLLQEMNKAKKQKEKQKQSDSNDNAVDKKLGKKE